eukprot:6167268-Amphidinium_carterae.1
MALQDVADCMEATRNKLGIATAPDPSMPERVCHLTPATLADDSCITNKPLYYIQFWLVGLLGISVGFVSAMLHCKRRGATVAHLHVSSLDIYKLVPLHENWSHVVNNAYNFLGSVN